MAANVYKARNLSSYAVLVSHTQTGKDSGNNLGAHSLRHVAELAGVSVATASRVMSGSSHPVSEATRQRVLAAADRLAFEPNRLARALVTARSQTVGVIVHDISDPYFGDIVKGLEKRMHEEDYRLFVASADRDPDKELSYFRAFQAHQVDAVVFAASSLTDPDYTETLQRLAARFKARGGVIVILSDHVLTGPKVRFDNHKAVRDMVRYLAGQGHSRIGYIGGPSDLLVSRARLAGFQAAIDELGLVTGDAYVVDGQFTMTGGEAAMASLLEKVDVTAVLAANDLMAIGATRKLLASGHDVPGDISVAGLDDIPMAAYAPVPLTTMHVPTYDVGRFGADLVLAALDDEEPEDVQVFGEIIERQSVGEAPRQV